jgi:hypothetical protein
MHNTKLPNTPYFQTGFVANLNISSLLGLKAELFAYYSMNYTAAFYRHSEVFGKYNKDEIPQQLVANSGLGYTFENDRLSLALDFQNMFNEQVFDNFAVQKPGRAGYVKATFRIY